VLVDASTKSFECQYYDCTVFTEQRRTIVAGLNLDKMPKCGTMMMALAPFQVAVCGCGYLCYLTKYGCLFLTEVIVELVTAVVVHYFMAVSIGNGSDGMEQ
jgi:hypothetical protein